MPNCKTMKEETSDMQKNEKSIKKAKNYKTLLTESEKSLLPRSCDINPLKANDVT